MAGLTQAENELLTRTGPGTPMGNLFREYWIPAMLSERLPAPDCAPIAIMLLGERLVAFRDTQGRVGILDEYCPHRRASLVYGRNEEGGLRCVYHAWKFDVAGRVIDIPSELPNSRLAQSIAPIGYPAREAGGIVWTYLGNKAEAPPFPDFLFTQLPANRVLGWHYHQECNYLQGMEADLDIGHPGFLHAAAVNPLLDPTRRAMGTDRRPRAYTREETFGFQTVWGWKTEDPAKSLFWVDPFVVPFHTIVPAGRTQMRWIWHAWVPIDDHSHWLYYVHYDSEIDPDAEEKQRLEQAFGHDLIDPENDYRSRGNQANLHLLDRERQKHENFTGIRGVAAQDIAITQSMGAIVDRSREHLTSGDILVIQLRNYLLKTVREHMAGKPAPGQDGGFSYPDIDSRMQIVPSTMALSEILDHPEWKWGDITEKSTA